MTKTAHELQEKIITDYLAEMMTKKKTYRELYDELEPYNIYIGKLIFHTKSGGIYKFKDIFYKENDMSIWFSYYPVDTVYSVLFSRPIGELTDGRFSF